MNTRTFAYWLSGFIEGKENLSIDELYHVKSILDNIIDDVRIKPSPSKNQIKKMVDTLFPSENKNEDIKQP